LRAQQKKEKTRSKLYKKIIFLALQPNTLATQADLKISVEL